MYQGIINSFTFWLAIFFASNVAAQEYLDFIFADFKIDNRIASSELELVTRDYKTFYISIEQFNEHMAANVSLNVQTGKLLGVFWDEPVELQLAKTDFIIEDEELFVAIDVLAHFPVEYSFNHAKQWLSVITNDKHPKTHAIIQEQRKNLIAAIKSRKAEILVKENEYRLFTPPNIDMSYTLKSGSDVKQHGYTQMTHDLLYHQADIQISSGTDSSTQGQFVLSRKFNFSLIPMTYKVGDLKLSQSSFLGATSRGAGIYIAQDERRSQKLSENLTGYVLPNTEVELFQGDYLIDFSIADYSGYYEFENLDFKQGNLSYKIKFTAPDGKVSVREITPPSWQGLRVGQWTPEFTYIDGTKHFLKSRPSISAERFATIGSTYTLDNNKLIRSGVEWKETEGSSESLPFLDFEWRQQGLLTLASKFGYDNKVVYENLMRLYFGHHEVDFQMTTKKANNLVQRTRDIGYSFNLDRWRFQSNLNQFTGFNVKEKKLTTKLGFKPQGKSFFITWDKKIRGERPSSLSLVASAFGYWGSANLSLSREYSDKVQDSISINYSKPWNGYNFSSSVKYSTQNHKVSFSSRFSKSWGKFSANMSASKSADNELLISANISFSFSSKAPVLTLNSRSYRRGATINNFAFLDKDYDGHWAGEDEEPILEGVTLEASSIRGNQFELDKRNHLFGVDAYDPKIFHVNAEDLDNPFLIPAYPSVQLESHPGGVIDIAIPFQQVFELEGEVVLIDQHGKPVRSTGYVPLEIINTTNQTEPNRIALTEQDGFYIVDKVRSGQYRLTVQKEFLEKNQLECEFCDQALDTENADDFILYTKSIILRPINLENRVKVTSD